MFLASFTPNIVGSRTLHMSYIEIAFRKEMPDYGIGERRKEDEL
jgi:hypothetical protein